MAIKKVKLGEYCDIKKGKTGIKKAIPGKYPMVVTAEDRITNETYDFDCKAVIIPLVSSTGHGHASINRLHYQEGKFALGTILAAVTVRDEQILDPRFLFIYLSYFKDKILVPLMKGSANVSLNISKISNVEIILPTLERQKEIIELEKENVRILSLENEISIQKDQILKLKQSILQDAIKGRLTEDWRKENPDVEPTSKLLERLKKEKEQLIKDKKIKKEKPLSPITEGEIPFDIPENWEWVRLGDLGEAKIGLTYNPADVSDQGVIVLRSSNIRNGKIDLTDLVKVKSNNSNKLTQKGDILICARNGSKHLVGKSALVETNGMYFGAFMSVYRSKLYKYTHMFLQSDIFRIQFDDEKSTGINQLTQGVLRNIIIPLPPIHEQKIIVEKVKELFQKISSLEEEVKNNKENTQVLMQAVLKDAFTH